MSSDDLTAILQNAKNATYTQYTVRHVRTHRTVHRVAMRPTHVVTHRRVAMRHGRTYVVSTRRYYAVAPIRRVAGASSWRYRYPAYYASRYRSPGYDVTSTGSIVRGPAQQSWRQYYSPMNQVGYEYGYPRGLGYLNTGIEPTSTGSIGLSPGFFSGGGGGFPQWSGQTWISYCSRRFPTYDSTSDTFWGPDGQQHLCF
ncbi:BA14K family protein [Microvirga sp. 2MCAF38]|uniref:BA14K family protein n=1 Tax=Microvirga sp. 2MCAF38 TaxID=3232989 RepID=UPI003F9B3D7D